MSESSDLSLNFSCFSQILHMLLHLGLFSLELFSLYSWHLVLLSLIGCISLELIVGEFMFDWNLPSFYDSESLVCLSLSIKLFRRDVNNNRNIRCHLLSCRNFLLFLIVFLFLFFLFLLGWSVSFILRITSLILLIFTLGFFLVF